MSNKNTTTSTGKWSVALALIPTGGVLLFLLPIMLGEHSGEAGLAALLAIVVILLYGVPAILGSSIIGAVLAGVALRRTERKSGTTGLVLNLMLIVASCFMLAWIHSDWIAWRLSHERKIDKAINMGNVEAVKKHLEKGVDVNFLNRQGMTPLQRAISSRDREIVEILLNNRADVNKAGDRKVTPLLHLLAIAGGQASSDKEGDDFEVAKLLLEHGANPNVVSDWPNKTPLLIAAERGDEKMVDLLLAYGVDINQKGIWTPGQTGNTALHYAAWKGNKEMALLLLDKGADVNVRGVNKVTPLHKVSGPDKEEMIELLLSRGADPNARDRFGRTSLKKQR